MCGGRGVKFVATDYIQVVGCVHTEQRMRKCEFEKILDITTP